MGDGIAQGAIDATGIAAGLEGYAFARVAAVPVTPPPAGLRRRPRHENARAARHENGQASRRSTKRQGRFLDRSENIRAKSKKGFAEFSDSRLVSLED